MKLCPEVSISGERLKQEIDECIFNLKETDDHSANANTFLDLSKVCDGEKRLYIYQQVYGKLPKSYLFLIFFIWLRRNNLLSRKKNLFLTFSFDKREDIIEFPEVFILWNIFNDSYKKDDKLGESLKKVNSRKFRTLSQHASSE